MKKRILSIIAIVISFLLMYGSISITKSTIENAQNRVVELKFTETELIEENPNMDNPDTIIEETEEEKTNSYTGEELAIIITASTILASSFIMVIYATMVLFGGIKNINSFKVAFTYALLVIILSETIIINTINKSDNYYLNGESFKVKALKREQALHVINSETSENNKVYESTKKNESVLKITDKALYNGVNLDITKTSGELTNDEEGVNNVVLATNSSKVTIKDSTITSNNQNSSAIYATKINTVVDLDNVKITTTENNSKAIITTNDSELTITNSSISTSGIDSELFSSSSTIIVDNVTGNTKSNIASIIKDNSLSINNSHITTELQENKSGIFTIDSNEEAYSEYTTASLTIENSTIDIEEKSEFFNTTPLFHIKNTNSKIYLTKNKITYGKQTLISIETSNKYTAKTTTLTMTDTIIKGDILIDSNSEAKINLNNVIYTGSINPTDLSPSVDITLDKTSKWYLTNHSYINRIQIQKNTNITNYIYSNGYNIYYNAANNETLNGRTIYLPGGGKLIPINKAS